MKARKILTLLLATAMLAGVLCGCGGSKKAIREDIQKALAIDEAGEQKITEFFAAADEAFAALLEKDTIKEKDMVKHARKIEELATDFEDTYFTAAYTAFSEKQVEADSEESEIKKSLLGEYILTSNAGVSLRFYLALYDAGGEVTGETLLEKAVSLVNAYAAFFYGEEAITEEDMDKLDEKL